MKNWLMVDAPDNPMAIALDAIAYIVKMDDRCKVRTCDGTDHIFHANSYEDMLARILAAQEKHDE